jgi:hypothetical protein
VTGKVTGRKLPARRQKKPALLRTTNAYGRAGADPATDAPLLLEPRLWALPVLLLATLPDALLICC